MTEPVLTGPVATGPALTDAPRDLAGSCLCGAVRYAVADAFAYAMNCHCAQCRRATGAAFKPFAGIARDRLRVTVGEDDLMSYRAGAPAHDAAHDGAGGEASDVARAAHDARCRRCGSLLWSVVRDGAFVHVTLGTLTDAPSIRPGCHIFTGSKAPWFTITDDLPQYAEFPE
ncbi:GFA family protein [Ferrovibrio xuzhouensis]|uniref:GFA family protein n=1 Tax=Ferrovibrio xuzhouensis TaxID=1576914 RepID=A0ABV7VII1_9PROT